jgi:hypothetical protein
MPGRSTDRGQGAEENTMQIEITCSTFTLAPAGLLTVQDGIGTRIVCRSGYLWITQQGDVKDSIVGPNDVLTIRKSGRTVISALESSSLTLIEPDTDEANAGVLPRRAPRLVTASVACS